MNHNTQFFRTREIEEYSNLYLIHPLSAVLVTRFAKHGWRPNVVSVLGLVNVLVAAVCFYYYQAWYVTIVGFLFLVGWHVFDGADGQLARLTGQTSEFGKLVDGLCDQLGYVALYSALSLATQPFYGPWVWLLCVVSALSHLTQASALEYQRDMYDCWVHRQFDKCVPTLEGLQANLQSSNGIRYIIKRLYLIYVRFQYRFAATDVKLLFLEQRTRELSEYRKSLGELYRKRNLRSVHHWTWLSANKRSMAIALCCMVKLPLLYFVHELVVLNFILYLLILRQRRINRQLVAEMGESNTQ